MPDQARAPLALRALARRLARPEAPTFDLELLDGSVHRMGLGDRPAFRIALRSPRGWQAPDRSQDDSLEEAAQNKLDWILDACRLEAGQHVLDVGGGWGSFAGYAGSRGVDVTMLTISREQYAYLSEWCATHTLPGRSKV